MKKQLIWRLWQLCTVGFILELTGGCAALLPSPPLLSSFYSIDSIQLQAKRGPSIASTPLTALTMIVKVPSSVAGFATQRIIYTRKAHKLEYFAHSEWVGTPARMLAPLIVSAVEKGGAYRAVLLSPSPVVGELVLNTEIVRLQQEFDVQPSRVRFTLRAYIVDNATRKVVASHEFDETVATMTDDPFGGVVAANYAVQAALEKLATFCNEAAFDWKQSFVKAPLSTK